MWLRFANGAEEYFGPRYSGRAISVGLVLLIHAAILAIFLYGRKDAAIISEPREMILRLFPVVPSKKPIPPNAATAPKSEAPPKPQYQLETNPPASPAEPDVTPLGRALNGCNLEDLDKLSPEARSNCVISRNAIAGAIAKGQSAVNGPSHSQNAQTWADAIRKRNTPLGVDCVGVSTEALGIQQNTKSTAVMVDVLCVLRHLVSRQSPIH